MKKLFLLLIWLNFFINGFGQTLSEKKVDSLYQKLLVAKLVDYKLIFDEIKYITLQLSNTEAIAISKKIIEKTKIGNLSKRAYFLAQLNLAEVYFKNGDEKKSDKLAYQIYQYAEDNYLQYEKGLAVAFLAQAFNLRGLNAKGLQFSKEALEIFEKLDYPNEKAYTNYEIGMAYYQGENFAKAQFFLEIALKIGIHSFAPRIKINIFNTLGLAYQKQQNYVQAVNVFEKALGLAHQNKDSVWIGLINGNIGEVKGLLGDYEIAQEFLESDIVYSKKFNLSENLANTLRISGDFYMAQNKLDNAKERYKQISGLIDEKKVINHSNLLKCYQSFATFYFVYPKDIDKVFEYQNLAMAMKDSIFKQNKNKEMAEIQALIDLEKKDKELIKLKNTNTIQQKTITFQQEQRTILFAVIVLLGMFAFVMYHLNQQKNTANQLLQLKNKKIEEQNQALSVQQEEIYTQNTFIEVRAGELEVINQQLTAREQELEETYEKLVLNEKLVKTQNEILKKYNLNLKKEVQKQTRDLVEKNFELINYNSQLEQFAFVTAHNIRGPIARLLGLASIFEKDENLSTQNLWIIEKVDFTAKELDRIVKDLNAILEAKNGIGELIEDVDIADKIDKVEQILEVPIAESQAEIAVEINLETPVIKSVGVYLESIFYNLMSNAIKYRNPDTPLKIRIQVNRKHRNMILKIQDNGLGMDLEKYQDKVFGIYQRFHNHIEGKGLGLHLVKLQVEALGGSIGVESVLNEGTTFTVKLKKIFEE